MVYTAAYCALRAYDWTNTKIERPVLDGQQHEEIIETICAAMEFVNLVEISYSRWDAIETFTGHVYYRFPISS
ncbi:YolD-like family protein [Fictibacillus sp. NRS-1165]|uniref:YolD-like family protein n=1 Tax=Fictibacillus sp. NRS-1165 TaxID=3144463 RepID=UPI003D225143